VEIKLNDADMERLAALVSDRLKDRVIGAIMAAETYEAVAAHARGLATMHMGTTTYNGEATDAMRRALTADGSKLLRAIVTQAVRDVRADDPELTKTVRRAIYEDAVDAAERAARALADN
jgi:hypothetical protein